MVLTVDHQTTQNAFQNRTQNEAKLNIENNQKIVIRMQGTETSKPMLPCGCRVHLHQLANFKTVFKQIQTNHTNYAKNDPGMAEQHIKKMMLTNIETLRQIRQIFRFWLPCWSQLLGWLPLWRVFCCDLFFGTSGGYPLGPILASLGALLVRFCQLFVRFQ